MNLISGPGNIQSQIESIQNHDANILIADYRTRNDKKIIGVNDPYLKTDPTTLMQDVDFSTYGDRAIIKLTNSTGTTVEWRGACIVAKPIVQYSNANGYKWTYSDYADIERNGEKSATIGNDYIISADQVESIGDYWSKELKPHNVYSLVYPGCLYHLQRGDVWHLTLSYTCPGGISESELIDVDVEIVGTEIKKSVGGIGETIIDCRVPSGAWSKTTSRRARLIGAGKAEYLLNRSNTLTVAASTWTGQADLFCDGTADDVQIQAAIDRLSAQGGGEIILTRGTYYIASNIDMADNIYMHGEGDNSILYFAPLVMLRYMGVVGTIIESFTIDAGGGASARNNIIYTYAYPALTSGRNAVSHITVKNIAVSPGYDFVAMNCTGNAFYITECTIGDISASSGAGDLYAIYGANSVIGTIIGNVTSVSGIGACMAYCKKCQQNKTGTATTAKYRYSYASESGAAGTECADTAAGGYNS